MILFRKADAISAYLNEQKKRGLSIGFVPTMGALHQGHLELLNSSRQASDITIVSIFVNPAQFNDLADYRKYPSTIEQDISLLISNSADILFLPTLSEIYPQGFQIPNNYDLGELELVLEGKFRPGHFQGVARVMDRLLGIVNPSKLFMGRKDYQQCMVVEKLIELKNFDIALHKVETVREADGLAMSSRNLRLSREEREDATAISRALLYIKENIAIGNQEQLLETARRMLIAKKFRIDYLELVDAVSLEIVSTWNGSTPLVAIAAAFLNEVRLIDNMSIS